MTHNLCTQIIYQKYERLDIAHQIILVYTCPPTDNFIIYVWCMHACKRKLHVCFVVFSCMHVWQIKCYVSSEVKGVFSILLVVGTFTSDKKGWQWPFTGSLISYKMSYCSNGWALIVTYISIATWLQYFSNTWGRHYCFALPFPFLLSITFSFLSVNLTHCSSLTCLILIFLETVNFIYTKKKKK